MIGEPPQSDLMFRAGPLLLVLAFCPGMAAGELPVRVTTDSSAYCAELAARFAAESGTRPDAARTLAEEGRRLCDTGHVRTGIAKLRRALRAAQTGG
jgi:hypothetical protein